LTHLKWDLLSWVALPHLRVIFKRCIRAELAGSGVFDWVGA